MASKPQKPKFDNVTKPGSAYQTFKPNEAMQAQLRADMEKAGFSYDVNGNIDFSKMPRLNLKRG